MVILITAKLPEPSFSTVMQHFQKLDSVSRKFFFTDIKETIYPQI